MDSYIYIFFLIEYHFKPRVVAGRHRERGFGFLLLLTTFAESHFNSNFYQDYQLIDSASNWRETHVDDIFGLLPGEVFGYWERYTDCFGESVFYFRRNYSILPPFPCQNWAAVSRSETGHPIKVNVHTQLDMFKMQSIYQFNLYFSYLFVFRFITIVIRSEFTVLFFGPFVKI